MLPLLETTSVSAATGLTKKVTAWRIWSQLFIVRGPIQTAIDLMPIKNVHIARENLRR
jgi:hypothetical protein